MWILQIIDAHRSEPNVSIYAAKTMLNLIEHHDLTFDYTEHSIIKRFNKVITIFSDIQQIETGARDIVYNPPDTSLKTTKTSNFRQAIEIELNPVTSSNPNPSQIKEV